MSRNPYDGEYGETARGYYKVVTEVVRIVVRALQLW